MYIFVYFKVENHLSVLLEESQRKKLRNAIERAVFLRCGRTSAQLIECRTSESRRRQLIALSECCTN